MADPRILNVPFQVPGASPEDPALAPAGVAPCQQALPTELGEPAAPAQLASLVASDIPAANPLALLAKRGRHASRPPLTVEFVRDIGEADLPVLTDPSAQPAVPVPRLTRLRHQHHLLAQLLANGVSNVDASYVSGYTPERIYQLRQDPAFQELLASYQDTKELAFVDVMARMRDLGLSALEELQTRLDERPEDFSPTKLLEVMKALLVEGRAGPGMNLPAASGNGAGGQPGPVVPIQINFVPAGGPTIGQQ